jgi:hypothetical protein
MQKTGLSASIFWLCQKDLRCNPWRGPRASGDFARKKLVHPGNSTYFFTVISAFFAAKSQNIQPA